MLDHDRMQRLLAAAFHDVLGHPYQIIPGLGDVTGEMGLLRQLHEEAMDSAQTAHEMKVRHNVHDEAAWWVAFRLEHFVAIRVNHQPGKSILARSAAALALEIGLKEVVSQLVTRGLEDGCPGDIAEELRQIAEAAHGKESGS